MCFIVVFLFMRRICFFVYGQICYFVFFNFLSVREKIISPLDFEGGLTIEEISLTYKKQSQSHRCSANFPDII